MNFRKTVKIFFVLLLVAESVAAFPQTDSTHWNYIKKYTQAAINEMYYSRIPASITMAQALHESRYGTSELAVKANNHFGIKCQNVWTGKQYTYQDDDANTCFRHYDSVAQSYRDHSDFLMTRPRYAFLFELNPTDYVAWAHGLKKAGYATNPNYAPILIKLIEDYKLYMLDTMQPALEQITSVAGSSLPNKVPGAVASEAKVFHRNRIEFFIVRPGDNIAKLTKELGLLKWEIRKYNEIGPSDDVHPGQLIYLQPKRRQAESGYNSHTAEKGESMYDIAQMYGVRLKCLYKRNRMVPGVQPQSGQVIWLRGMRPLKQKK